VLLLLLKRRDAVLDCFTATVYQSASYCLLQLVHSHTSHMLMLVDQLVHHVRSCALHPKRLSILLTTTYASAVTLLTIANASAINPHDKRK
jgi:hypothetical protein